MRRNRYNIPRPTWTCPHCGFVHSAADIVRINNYQLRCKQCQKAFTPPSAERGSPGIGFTGPEYDK